MELIEPTAWLHKLHMEAGQTYDRLTSNDGSDPDEPSRTAFGRPGRDYSEEYHVTTTPLYTADALASLTAENERNMSDTQRLLFTDEAVKVCPTADLCFEYSETVRCGPCAIKLAEAAGVEPRTDLPALPEVSRLKRENARLVERVRELEEGLKPFAKAAMGVRSFDPDFPMEGAALRASFDWYDKAQGDPLSRHSVRRSDLERAAALLNKEPQQ